MDGTERGGERMRKHEMKLEFDSRSCNEGFARVAVAAFLTQLNPTLEEVEDETLWIEVIDHGRGIADVAQAMVPLYTTRQECDRAGMGFTFMDAFMDTLEVTSVPEKGTTVRMSRHITRKNVDGPFDYRDHKLPVAICR